MLSLVFALLLGQSGFFGARFGTHGAVGRAMGGLADKVITLRITSDDTDTSSSAQDADPDAEDDSEPDLEVVPPAPPVPPVPPIPPRLHGHPALPDLDAARDLPRFSEKASNVPTAELLHRIAQTAGWSMTLVGAPKDRIDIDVKDADPREALREVLKKSGAMGVLKNDKLVVVATPDAQGAAGTLIEKSSSSRHLRVVRGTAKTGKRSGRDLVRVFQGDLSVPQGQIVQGDVVCVGGSVELQPGSVVQGDAVAVGGSVSVAQGALVMGQAVSVLGKVEVERGGQVMGEHVQVGLGKILSGSRSTRHHSWLGGLGVFGLFPTIALFALTYLIGLVMLRMWPERVRNVGFAMFENPVRSFTVGFLCWLLLLPLTVLLAISIVGIPLIPLLPVIVFLSIVVGLSSFALRIGESLPAGPGQRFVPPAALGMGMTVLLLLAFVPWLGISLLALLQFFALGASVSSRFGRALPPHPA
jgi:uncharacterized membrane protein